MKAPIFPKNEQEIDVKRCWYINISSSNYATKIEVLVRMLHLIRKILFIWRSIQTHKCAMGAS